jgi:hypothetical protein
MIKDWPSLLTSVSRALWGMVTPQLRSVAVGTPSSDLVVLRFTYELLSLADRDIPNEVAAELAADFPNIDVEVLVEIAPNGHKRELREGENWAYLRREI